MHGLAACNRCFVASTSTRLGQLRTRNVRSNVCAHEHAGAEGLMQPLWRHTSVRQLRACPTVRQGSAAGKAGSYSSAVLGIQALEERMAEAAMHHRPLQIAPRAHLQSRFSSLRIISEMSCGPSGRTRMPCGWGGQSTSGSTSGSAGAGWYGRQEQRLAAGHPATAAWPARDTTVSPAVLGHVARRMKATPLEPCMPRARRAC